MKLWEKVSAGISLVCIVLGVYFYMASYNYDLHYVYDENTGSKIMVNLPHPEWRPTAMFWIAAGIGLFIFTVIWHNMRVADERRQMERALGWKILNGGN